MKKQTKILPKEFKPFLWSYDLKRINLDQDKKTIIFNILNFGTYKATNKLFQIYSLKDIKQTIKDTYESEWDKKSLNFWSLILGVKPKKKKRF